MFESEKGSSETLAFHLPGNLDVASFNDTLSYGGVLDLEKTILTGVSRRVNYDAATPGRTIAEALENSIREALESSGKIGCMLSGGVDSSLVLAALCRATDKTIHTFNLVFGEPDDELDPARVVSESLGTTHHVIRFDIPDILERARNWTKISPYGRFAYPAVMEAAAKSGIDVLFSGEGGDEAFAGYSTRYIRMLKYKRYRYLRWPARALSFLPGSRGRVLSVLGRTGSFPDFFDAWQSRVPGLSPKNERIWDWDRPDWMTAIIGFEKNVRVVDYLSHIQCHSVAAGLEIQYPILNGAVESFSTPTEWGKLWDGSTLYGKYPLLATLREIAPPDVEKAARRPKHGFSPPAMDVWWKNGLYELHEETLKSPVARLLPPQMAKLQKTPDSSKNMLYGAALSAWGVSRFLDEAG
jgi:asparagine synthetase B (glutamine-hydrolysing)